MMRTMRASAKWIMGIVAVSFVGWMIFQVGMDVTGASGPSVNDAVARVNGQKIDVQTFYGAVRNAQDQQRQAGTPLYTLDQQRALEDEVLESMVQQIALVSEYKRRGITVTDDEIREAAQTQPPPEMFNIPAFQTDGQFDFEKYKRYLQSQTDISFKLALEARYRDELPRIKLFQRATADIYLPDSKLWQIYRDRYDSVSVRVITILPELAAPDDQIEVTDQEVESYYRSHQEDYHRPATAYLSFIQASREPDVADTAVALQRVRDILKELRAGGDFAEIAARESADSGSRQEGGDLGETPVGTHIAAFSKAAMALKPGQISEPVLTSFGYHIIKLESKSKDKYHARHILIPIELQGDHLRFVESRADTMDLYAAEQDDPTALDDTADRLGIPVAKAPPLAEGSQMRIGRYAVPDVGIWAFEAIENETSRVIESDHAFYVFRLDSLEAEGTSPLNEVRDRVVAAVKTAKKWEQAEELARAVDAEIKSGVPFGKAALRHGLTPGALNFFTRGQPSPALASSPEAVGAAFGVPVDQVSGPIKTKGAIFFIRPTAFHGADSTAFAKGLDEFRTQVLQQARQRRVELLMAAIRDQADVVDNRKALARAQRAQPALPFGQSNPLPNSRGF
ncbi:MAG: peptidylprolyl isomerase [Gemmatimonadales bacterium]